MKNIFNNDLKAELSIDDRNQVRQILHTGEYYALEKNNSRSAAIEYFEKLPKIYNLTSAQTKNMHQQVSFLEPREQEMEYRVFEEKNFFDSSTIGFFQTINNVPVWGAGLSVTIKQNPNRVVLSTNNSKSNVKLKLPSEKSIERWRNILLHQSAPYQSQGFQMKRDEQIVKGNFFHEVMGVKATSTKTNIKSSTSAKLEPPQLIRGRFYAYKYDAKRRQDDNNGIKIRKEKSTNSFADSHITLPLPPVSEKVKDGSYYLVAEITFSFYTVQYGNVNWLALVEVETNSVLYLRALRDNLNAKVITLDPARTGSSTISTANNATLNPFRTDQVLQNLDAPVMGTQALKGSFANVAEFELPTVATPTEPGGTDFNFDIRTNNFAAVNAYYHVDQFFRMMEDLGFNIPTFFSHSTFPIHVDHRGRYGTLDGIEVNAHCDGNGVNGISLVGFCLDDLSDTANPLGISIQYDVTLHELGGHGVLYEHIGSANLPFAHSVGDSVAVIQNDPSSVAADRFFSFPWVRIGGAVADRRHDRSVAAGWAFGGSNDVGGYNTEQILSTTHFRIYRSIGGDHPDLGRRQFAARAATYLIMRTISNLTPATSPANALAWCNALMAADLLNWTSEGLFGGAYNKVIRWSFEKQGLFQAPGTPTPITSAGQPPAVDVYINDGRNGEYQFQEVHWENLSIWNQRNIADPPVHAEPIIGATNYAYVKVKNRGTTDATNVTVRAYHCLPGAGLTWPTDFTEMSPAGGQLQPIIHANNADEIVFGPFSWVPNTNAYGHDCILMVASQASDPSNVDNFTAGESVAEWRLVPNDNNVGQRNVYPVAGGGGLSGLMESLDGKVFYAGNPFRKPATISLKVQLPEVLKSAGWQMNFRNVTNNQFLLKPGEKREVVIALSPGSNFTKQQILETADNAIKVFVYADNMLMGGMTYQMDPAISRPFNRPGKSGKGDCKDKAKELLNCLNIGNENVKNVSVKNIIVDIQLDNDCSC